MSMHATLTPAYGRDYTTPDAAAADWAAGKDFIIHGPPHLVGQATYCSSHDTAQLKALGITTVRLRFNAKTDSVDIPL